MINRNYMLELTRRMTDKRSHLIRVAGAYLDEEGYVDGTINTNFTKLVGLERKHVLEIAKTIPFSETNKELKEYRLPDGAMKPGSIWQALYALRQAELKNDAILLSLYELLGEKLPAGRNYAIYLYEGAYDIPRKAADGTFLSDSEEIYQYLICAICPANADYEAGLPEAGFLWPAFKNRGAALNYVDFYEQGGSHPMGGALKKVLAGK